MSVTEQTRAISPASALDINLGTPMDRRTDVEVKQSRIAALLQSAGCDGLLVLNPDNFAWLSGGGAARGILDPDALPALYFTQEARWLISGNADSQRIFDEEIDGLGFQLTAFLAADQAGGRLVRVELLVQHVSRAIGCRMQRMPAVTA